ncbi:ABC transporter permease [Oscillatoria sp. CS-180]|uniref:cell division protein FtsX n=1 Tax=Oscillatoria sp. CS-180 TaxID=3021720 RepID=UPI0023305C22|nr:ABC transporter permease [Oscillatoria sp. CS-180]MDB9527359.1 ABC transporter permease [Oscillatoria sp. CS-180]
MLKAFTKADYLIRETLLGLRRGGWMNWAAISTMTVLLFLFGVSLQASWQLEGLLNQFGSQLEVSVYLDSGVQADSLQDTVAALPEVTTVESISKEVAWEELVSDLGISDIAGATEQLKGNPLVDALRVKASRSEAVPTLAAQLSDMEGVNEVLYVDEAVQRLQQLNDGLRWASVVVVSILSLTAIAVITTTIRLIVMARRHEIEVMQLVGATNIWIYLPFILQGAFFGLVGAGVAWSLLTGIHRFLRELVNQQPDFIQFVVNGLELTAQQALLLPSALLGLGCIVGLMGSLVAVRKYALK